MTAPLPRTIAKRFGPARYRLVCEGHEFICQQWAHSAYTDPPHWYQRGINWHLSDSSKGYRIASFSALTYAKVYVSEYIAHQGQSLPEAALTRVDEGTYMIACGGRTWWLWDHRYHGVKHEHLDLRPGKPWLLMVKPTPRAAVWAYRTVDEAVHSCRVESHDDQWELRADELVR